MNSINATTVRDNALRIQGRRRTQQLRQYLYPQIAFSCNGTVTKWIYGANYRSNNQYTATPQLQIWRETSNSYTLIENSTVDATARNASNLYEFIPQTPLKFQEGDIFGVYIPENSISKLRLFEQRLSGPNNFRQTNVSAPLSTLDLPLGLDSDNDFPLVTVEISKPFFSLLPLHSLLGTSVSSTSTTSLTSSSDIELATSYSLPTTTQSFVLSPLPTLPPASSTIQFTTNPASLSPSSLISSQGSTITSSSSSNTISSDTITSSIDNEPMVTSSPYPTAVTMMPHLTSSTHFQTANTITSYSTTKQTSTASSATSLTLSTSFSSSIIVLNNTSDGSSMTIIIAVISSVFLLIVFVMVVTALIIITHRMKKRKARKSYSVPQEGDDAFNNPTYGANNYTSVADYQQVTTENMSNLVYECK